MTKFLRNSGSTLRIGLLIAAVAGIGSVLVSCGGGGVAAVSNTTQTLAVLPVAPDLYDATPVTVTISGGKAPYTVVSANTSILPTPTVDGNKITLIAKAVTADTPVKVTVRDSATTPASQDITANVRVSFLLNSVTLKSSLTDCAQVCSGDDALVTVPVVLNGVPQPGRSVKFEAIQGAFGFILSGTNQVASTVTVTTDSTGIASVFIRVQPGVTTQTALMQITDVVSGQKKNFTFTITQIITSTAITVTPSSVSWTGVYNNACVTGGFSTHVVYGGTPPYTITSTNPPAPNPQAITITTTDPPSTPPVVSKQGGAVMILTTGLACTTASPNTVFVTDATGRQATITVDNKVGATPAPGGGNVTFPQPVANPSSFSLDCGATASAFLDQAIPAGYTGAAPVLVVTPLEPLRVSASIAGGIFSVTRLGNGPGGTGSTLVRISNGSSAPLDFTVSLNGSAPFACGAANNTGIPITATTGHTLGLNPGAVSVFQFVGGVGPYTVTSFNPAIVDMSTTGVTGSFGSPITFANTAFPFFFHGVAAGVTFATITDSSPTPQVYVIVVTVS